MGFRNIILKFRRFIGCAGRRWSYFTSASVIASSDDVNGRNRRGTTGSIPINEWSFSCVSVDNLNIKIYANSTLTNEYNETLSIGNWGGSWIVGQRGNSTFWYLGLLSEIKIHNRVLTQDEITTMYNATKSRYGIQ